MDFVKKKKSPKTIGGSATKKKKTDERKERPHQLPLFLPRPSKKKEIKLKKKEN